VIYIGTELYLGHGRDDFPRWLAGVSEVREEMSKGQITPFVRVVQQPDTIHNWKLLASEQKDLRQRNGKDWAYPDPDYRAQFNDW
jgi:alkylated DNA nucleotide flippase Atl1